MKKRVFLAVFFFSLTIIQNISAQTWSKIGGTQGFNGLVNCLYADTVNNVVYAGGNFTSVDGVPALNIAKWDGTSWQAIGYGLKQNLGAGLATVYSITMYNGTLYAAGSFNLSGLELVYGIAKWDGTAWINVGYSITSTSSTEYMISLCVYNGKLYAGGGFSKVGAVATKNIAAWDGTKWEAVAGGKLFGDVYNISTYKGELYVGGTFATPNSGPGLQYRIAKLNGTTWANVGTIGVGSSTALHSVSSFATYNNDLYVGGYFDSLETGTSNSALANHICKWNGTTWGTLGTGANAGVNVSGTASTSNYPISALAVYNGKLYVAGKINKAGATSVNAIATWDGTKWEAVGSGITGRVWDMVVYKGSLLIAGEFTSAGGVSCNNIVKYSLGTGIDEMSANRTAALSPNPFTEYTTLSIDPSIRLHDAVLSVYDLSGKLLRTITGINRNIITIERNDLSLGVYQYELKNSNITIATGKMMVH